MCPVKTPSSFITVFTAPASSAAGVNLSKYLWITVLFGIETFHPLTFKALKPFTASSNPSFPTSNARYA